MIEIVFDNSVCWGLEYASYSCSDIGEVFCLPFELGIGNLTKGALSDERFRQLSAWFALDPWIKDEYFFGDEMLKECREALEKLLDRLSTENEIRVWYDYTANSICGFYHFVSMMEDYNVKISAVCFNDHPKFRLQARGLGGSDYNVFPALLPLELKLNNVTRRLISRKWHEIESSPCVLRLCMNGRITPVPVDIFDSYIRYFIPQNSTFNALKLTGDILSYNSAIDYYFLQWRLACILREMDLKPIEKENVSPQSPQLARFIFDTRNKETGKIQDSSYFNWIRTEETYDRANYDALMTDIKRILKENEFDSHEFFQLVANLSEEQLDYAKQYLQETKEKNGTLKTIDLRKAHMLAVRNS